MDKLLTNNNHVKEFEDHFEIKIPRYLCESFIIPVGSNFNLLKELVSNYKKLDGEESHWYKWIKIPQKEINLNHPYLKVDGSKLHQLWYGTIKHAAGINTNNPKREKAEKSKKNKKKSKANKIIKAKGLNGLIKCLGCGAYCSNTSPLGRCGLCQIKK